LDENNGKSAVQLIVIWTVLGLLAVVGFVFLALADSFFSWELMPEPIERCAHGFLVRLVPME
jgi:hypothetical protein